MKIKIDNPDRLVTFVGKSLTSWKIHYVGENPMDSIYEYVLKDKEQKDIKILVQIFKETQERYEPDSLKREKYVKIYCKNLNIPQRGGCTKFIKVEHFKDVRRVFNEIHSGGREVK
jgi:hypothetical protein